MKEGLLYLKSNRGGGGGGGGGGGRGGGDYNPGKQWIVNKEDQTKVIIEGCCCKEWPHK